MSNRFPVQGLPQDVLFEEMEEARANDVDWRGGRVGVYTHFGGEDVLAVAKEASRRFFSENALGQSAFPSLKKFETEVISWTLGLLNGGDDAIGNITSGGTESIFMGVKTARDWARDKKPVAGVPEIIASETGHPALNKAAHYLGLTVKRLKPRADYRADVAAMEAAIGPNTIMLFGSAPQFPHGVIDPIEDLGRVARKHGLWLHVDACVGGYLLPFMRMLGQPIPDFDFSVPGVMSMSADLHKYGYSAKGASAVLFRDASLRPYQVFAFDAWSRGAYSSPTFAGTRPGGPIAAAWAVLRYLGAEGYKRIVAQVLEGRDRMIAGIEAIPGLRLVTRPDATILAFLSDDLDIFAVAEAMSDRGWFVSRSADPPAIHLGMMSMTHVEAAEQYLTDLRAAVDEVRRSGRTRKSAEVSYGG